MISALSMIFALVLLGSAFAATWLWNRLQYDLHKIPVAPDAVPGLGELRGWESASRLKRLITYKAPLPHAVIPCATTRRPPTCVLGTKGLHSALPAMA